MKETMQTPNTAKKKEPLLPFVLIIVLNVLVSFFYIYEDQLPPIPVPFHGTMLIICVSSLLFIFVLLWAGISLTQRAASSYIMWSLVASFQVCFVLLQYDFSKAYQTFGLHWSENIAHVTHDKWDALYFSIMTWTTVGYGDLVPNGASRVVACCEALLGTLYNGIVLAVVIYQLNLMAKPKG